MSKKENERPQETQTMLSLEEYGILCFTNSYHIADELNDRLESVLTSKPAYFWVPFLSHLIKGTDLSIDDIKVFIELSLNSLMTKNEARWNNRALGVEGMLATLDTVLFYSTRVKLKNPVLEHQSLLGSFIDDLLDRLEGHNLIEDKNIETISGAPVVMMGLLPLGFTKRTKLGEEMYVKINRILKSHELKRTIRQSPYWEHHQFHTIWEIFKTSIFTMEETFGPTKSAKK